MRGSKGNEGVRPIIGYDGRLGEGGRTDANAADELSCSPSASVFTSGLVASESSAYRLAARPAALPLVGVLGDGRGALLV